MIDPQQSAFRSILFTGDDAANPAMAEDEPASFHDLNLDQLVETLTSQRQEYGLAPLFFTPLRSRSAIEYRQGVYADLAGDAVHDHATDFAAAMRAYRDQRARARALHTPLQRPFVLLTSILTYYDAVAGFADGLETDELESDGMGGLRDWLRAHVASEAFIRLREQAQTIGRALTAIRYMMRIRGDKVTVSPFRDEPDYSAEVEATFARFRQGDVKGRRSRFAGESELDAVEAGVLTLLAQENPTEFDALEAYVRQNADSHLDPTVARIDRELQFYLSYLDHTRRLANTGLSFCMPTVSSNKAVSADGIFDIVLAHKLLKDPSRVVPNDVRLEGIERLIVVTGANQGGKTTFSRAFGQVHWLASLGLPVPGKRASLFLFDRLFTHYEKEEDITTLHSKLEDELVRLHNILEAATSDSIVIMNEIFTSTTLDDAVALGSAMIRQLVDRDLLAMCVTFVDELSTLSETTVSMVATVDPDDPVLRTFELERRPADGRAHALALAEKYGLTYAAMTTEIAS